MLLKELSGIDKCPIGKICSAVFENENGDFVFIGKKLDKTFYDELKDRVGPDESIIIVPRKIVECIKGSI